MAFNDFFQFKNMKHLALIRQSFALNASIRISPKIDNFIL
jgi:hypothetical protein